MLASMTSRPLTQRSKAVVGAQFASVTRTQRAQPAIPSPMTKPPIRIMIVAPTAVE
jgi:hypothetical protein